MTYWLELFAPETWREFREAGSTVVGFRDTMRVYLKSVAPGDVFLCYLTGGAKVWVGALRVIGPSNDQSPIWDKESCPAPLDGEPITFLEQDDGVPVARMEGRGSFYPRQIGKAKLSGFLRRGLNRFEDEDGELVLKLLKGVAQRSAPKSPPT